VTTTVWIDVEDLFEYALHYTRPSGIQRLAYQLYHSLHTQHGDSGLVRFVRHNTARNTFYIVTWPEVAAVFDRLASGKQPGAAQWETESAYARQRRFLRGLLHRLSPALRASLIKALRLQGQAFRAWWHFVRTTVSAALSAATRLSTSGRGDVDRGDFVSQTTRGDVVLALGSHWSHPEYAKLIRAQREKLGLRFGLMVYDLVTVRCPEWCERDLAHAFRTWFDDLLPLCDAVFAISQSTAADVTAYARDLGVTLPGAVMPLPLGTSLSGEPPSGVAARSDRQPPAGSYVLFVSTIEARKNHLLMFRIWRRMLDEMPRDQVPTLVFAGRVGWLVNDLMQQIINTDYLSGRLVLIEDASDAEIASLYRGCLFTVYPSFFEGWGLPVTESLAFGKPCLISDRTSLPEAGGNLARYLDPDDLHGSYAAVREILEDRGQLARWEAQIQREFRPVPWSATVDALIGGLLHPLAGESESRTTQVTTKSVPPKSRLEGLLPVTEGPVEPFDRRM
jgi:glycosyltransferase involved in cell wall biosynthesis